MIDVGMVNLLFTSIYLNIPHSYIIPIIIVKNWGCFIFKLYKGIIDLYRINNKPEQIQINVNPQNVYFNLVLISYYFPIF